MQVEFVTKENLQQLRMQLLNDIKGLLQHTAPRGKENIEGYKTKDVRRILGCCYNTLTALRVSRKLRAKKVLGVWYYNKDDVRKLVEEGF